MARHPLPHRRPAIARGRVAGFTLVEIVVVLAIAALLMTAVPPLFDAVMPGVQLKGAARRTVASLRLARDAAIRSGSETVLVIDVEARRLELRGYRPVSLPTGLTLDLEVARRELLDEDRGAVRFFPDGSSTGGRIVLSRGEGQNATGYQVGVNWLTGRVRMAPWSPE
jgi:general secretion pathway protein H